MKRLLNALYVMVLLLAIAGVPALAAYVSQDDVTSTSDTTSTADADTAPDSTADTALESNDEGDWGFTPVDPESLFKPSGYVCFEDRCVYMPDHDTSR